MSRDTIARIDLNAISDNVRNAIRFMPGSTKLLAVVKADAYGHGSVEVARAAVEAGASYLAVALAEEGVALRDAGIETPVLILGVSNDSQMELAIDNNLEICVSCTDDVYRLIQVVQNKNRQAYVHLKVDTGMGRIGFSSDEDLISAVGLIKKSGLIRIDGMFSHLACADMDDDAYSNMQKQRFDHFADLLKKNGLSPLLHLANSAAMIQKKDFCYDMARFGISLYGYYPSDMVNRKNVFLKPVMSVHSRIVFVKNVNCGDSVSYGAAFTAKKKMRVATVPVGYGDGYNRLLSNRGNMIVVSGGKGYMCPVIGRVCMDQTMIDVSGVPSASFGDEVILLGRFGNLSITADDIAQLCNTISYEILLDFNNRIPRIYE